MGNENQTLYAVLSPEGGSTAMQIAETAVLDDLSNAVIGQVWDYMFRGDDVFAYVREVLEERHPGIRFVDYTAFGNIHGPTQDELTEALPQTLRDHGCNAVMVGIGACGSCTPAVTRASVSAEAAGFPTVSIVSTGFIPQAKIVARALGVEDLRIVEYPGVPMTDSPEAIREKAVTVLAEPLADALSARKVAA